MSEYLFSDYFFLTAWLHYQYGHFGYFPWWSRRIYSKSACYFTQRCGLSEVRLTSCSAGIHTFSKVVSKIIRRQTLFQSRSYYRVNVTLLFRGFICVFHRWFRQHEYIEKLNMQAILNASAVHDEFVKDLLVSYAKVSKVLPHPTDGGLH